MCGALRRARGNELRRHRPAGNSVGTKQLKKNSVVSAKVRDGTLRARELSNYNEGGDPVMTSGYVNSSFPPDTSSWFVSVFNPTDDPDFAFQAWAVCAPAAEVVYGTDPG